MFIPNDVSDITLKRISVKVHNKTFCRLTNPNDDSNDS